MEPEALFIAGFLKKSTNTLEENEFMPDSFKCLNIYLYTVTFFYL